MKKKHVFALLVSHCAVAAFGFAVGIYMLPIITAPPSPEIAELQALASQAKYTAQFRKDLQDSDMLHWGEGTVSVGTNHITLEGELAPGPDYKLYLSPEYVETEASFNKLKANMVRVGDVRTFENFVVNVPAGVDVSTFTTVIVWCEAFGQFITSARYR